MDYVEIRKELDRYNVFYSPEADNEELLDKFYSLPITEAQKDALMNAGIVYKDSWCWSRKIAGNFISEIRLYNDMLRKLPVSPQQKAVLLEHGVFDFEELNSGMAAEIIYNLPADREQIEYIRNFKLSSLENSKITYGYAMSLIRMHKSKLIGTDLIMLGMLY